MFNSPPEILIAKTSQYSPNYFLQDKMDYIKKILDVHLGESLNKIFFTSKLKREYIDIFKNTMMNLNTNEEVKEMRKVMVEKYDVFGLGIAMMYCYFKLEHSLNEKFKDALFNCFYGMIHPNVFLRYTPEQALMAYEVAIMPILEKHSLKINNNTLDHIIKLLSFM